MSYLSLFRSFLFCSKIKLTGLVFYASGFQVHYITPILLYVSQCTLNLSAGLKTCHRYGSVTVLKFVWIKLKTPWNGNCLSIWPA